MSDKPTYSYMLKSVRVSFPHLFTQQKDKKGKKVGYGAKLLLDPKNKEHVVQLNELKALMVEAVEAHPKVKKMPAEDKRCLRNGDNTERAENQGMFLVSTNARNKPYVFDATRKQVTSKKRNPIYSGCYVDCLVNIWIQNNEHGKRVNAGLQGMKFVSDGEALDGSFVPYDDVADAFDATRFDEDEENDVPSLDGFDDDEAF